MEHLPDEAFEGQPQRELTLAAVAALLGGRKEGWGQDLGQVLMQLRQSALAQPVSGAPAQGGQAWAQGGEKRRIHHKAVYIRPHLTASLKCWP